MNYRLLPSIRLLLNLQMTRMKKLYNKIRLKLSVYRLNKMVNKLDETAILFKDTVLEYDEAIRMKLNKIDTTK